MVTSSSWLCEAVRVQGSGWSLVALTVFKTVRDLTSSGWVGSIPMHSRHVERQRMPAACRAALAMVLLSGAALSARAQVTDTTRRVRVDTLAQPLQPPLSPRRAFVYSFFVPGYSQSVFGRNKAAAGFMLFEAISIAMIRESAADVHEARRARQDTLVVSWVDDSGRLRVPPDTVTPRFGDREVRSRQARVEDWIAVLVANHLLAGADAYVASHLWDVPARLGLRARPEGVLLMATLSW